MINDQLLGYVKQQLSSKIDKDLVVSNLRGAGWSDADIEEVFSAVGPIITPTTAPVSPSPVASPATLNVAQPIQSTQPVQTSQLTQTAVQADPVIHTKSKKKIFIIAGLILLCLVGGGAGYAYYTGFFISFPKLLSESMDKIKTVTSGSYDIAVGFDLSELKSITNELKLIPSLGIDSPKMGFNFKVSSDISDLNNLKSSSLISLKMGSFLAEVELRVVNNTIYVQLTKIPDLPDMPVPGYLFENKWFSFPYKTADGKFVSNPFAEMSSGAEKNILNDFTAEQKEHLYQIFRDAHIIKQVAKLNSEEMGGEFSYHFSFDLDNDAIVSYLQSLKEYMVSIGKNDLVKSEPDMISIRETLNSIKDFKGEVWIGRSDKLAHKFVVTFAVQPSLVSTEQMKMSFTGTMSDYNKPVELSAPTDSVPLQTIIDASLQNARLKGKEASIKANLSSMRAEAELLYDKNGGTYSGFCSSNNLISTKKNIEDNGGTGFVCKATAKAYAISTKLPTSNYWCVDSTGISAETLTSSNGKTVCPQKIQTSTVDNVVLPVLPTN